MWKVGGQKSQSDVLWVFDPLILAQKMEEEATSQET